MRNWFVGSDFLQRYILCSFIRRPLNVAACIGKSTETSAQSLSKNPFGAAADFFSSPQVVLIDLPSSDYGVLSLAKLRNVMLSPYSWNPSYIIGHSLRDIHSPVESTVKKSNDFVMAVSGD